jgi:hypothetical protein
MPRKLFFSILLAAGLFIFAGCEKDNDPPNSSIQGLWTGYYTVEGEPARGQQYFSFVIKPDGTLINDSKGDNIQHLSIGTWTLSGEAFTATTTCVYGHPSNIGIQETHTATFKNGKFSDGVWSNVAPRTGTGAFVITKVE